MIEDFHKSINNSYTANSLYLEFVGWYEDNLVQGTITLIKKEEKDN